MKKYILFFIAVIAVTTASAQSGYNYQELGVGVEASYVRGYTNVQTQYYHPALGVSFIYNYTPYVPIAAEIQFGQLSGGGLTTDLDKYGRQYTNHYKAVMLHADLHLGEIIDYEDSWILERIKNFYAGTGAGVIINTNKVQRTNVIPANGSLTYVFPGNDNSVDLMIPFRFGYEFKIYDSYNEPGMAIDIGYTHNFAFGEGLDGYNDDPAKFRNNATDQYTQITIGFKYFFGRVVSHTKIIRTFHY
ncbi:MAG TPA: hypothetical protein VGN20_01940 [Mucilaginibacter sp.]